MTDTTIPPEILHAASMAAFPGLPEGTPLDEANRRVEAAVKAAWPLIEQQVIDAMPRSTLSDIDFVDIGKRLDDLANDLASIPAQLSTTAQAIQQFIIQTSLACATCLHEERGGLRQGHNIANTVIDGTAYCNDHMDDVNGRLVPRKTSGLIVAGG